MNPVTIVLVVAAVGFVMARRLSGQLLEVKSTLVLPVVLSAVGLADLRDIHHLDAATVGFLALSLVPSVLFGLLRGASIHVGIRGTEVWMRYRMRTVLLWVANFGVKFALYPVEHAMSSSAAHAAGHALLLSIGLGLLAEGAVVLLRALPQRERLVWSKGEHGAPHRTSPQLDRLQDAVHGGPWHKSTGSAGLWRTLGELNRHANSQRHDW